MESPGHLETVGTQASTEAGITNEQWRAMTVILEKIYASKDEEKLLPDYYDVIKEPISLAQLKLKIKNKDYSSFADFVRDSALISHNAQMYNRPESVAYQHALIIQKLFEKEFKTLANQGVVSQEVATLPELGELPPVESPLPVEEEEEEEDDDDDEDDEDDEDDSDDEGTKRRRKRGPRSTAAITKREGGAKDDGLKGSDADPRKRRGRPPRVDTPMESRIKAVLKGIRKFKNNHGHIMVHQFEKLPDKVIMPEYYIEIKEPMAIEQIKRKQKRKKYNSVDHFMRDMDVMFNNAKSYNTDESQIYKDAVNLQAEAHKLADAEKQKSDSEYAMEEGRLPLPGGIVHNGEHYKVGDWIHIQNANDVTKPIVAQIYRTWQDTDGEKWINACWYYRPEQTVHQYEKHFFPNEVVKTGQYRDHRIDEIVDRCFVMFVTRYFKGRPTELSAEKEVYVCDSRYNEEKHRLNKIKTWASCLPDEVRDKDYHMVMFDHPPKKVKKVPSPILHMLKEDAKESDELPKPTWGADNAPPIVGAVYKGPRDENQSPPPEATPSPPPQPPPPAPKAATNGPNYDPPNDRRDSQGDAIMGGSFNPPSATPTHTNRAQSYTAPLSQYHQQSASPAPVNHGHQYSQQGPNSYGRPHQASAASSHLDHYSTPQSRYQPQAHQRMPDTNVVAQRPQEVFHLPENANMAIPEHIRTQFQQDANGHVLFFTSPPVDTMPPLKPKSALQHSARYLADRIRAKKVRREERIAAGLTAEEDEQSQPATKKPKQSHDDYPQQPIGNLINKALNVWNDQMQAGTDKIYQSLYGEHWEEGKKYELEKLARSQAEHRKRQAALAQQKRKSSWHLSKDSITDSGIYKDDLDPRY
ncbi:chromatin structure-remodeling complex subunit RSC1/2, partial [Lecanoromycetidae sp. Uapishka_2]